MVRRSSELYHGGPVRYDKIQLRHVSHMACQKPCDSVVSRDRYRRGEAPRSCQLSRAIPTGWPPPDQCGQAALPTLGRQSRRYILFVLCLTNMLFFYNRPSSSNKLLPDVKDLNDSQGE